MRTARKLEHVLVRRATALANGLALHPSVVYSVPGAAAPAAGIATLAPEHACRYDHKSPATLRRVRPETLTLFSRCGEITLPADRDRARVSGSLRPGNVTCVAGEADVAGLEAVFVIAAV